jgi:hypothetical protein
VANQDTTPANVARVDLKDPVLAGFLAWLIPGAGHMYQGRHAKGLLFFVCILGTFIYGMFLGRGQCVYAQWEPASMRRYSYLCQLGAGLPALPALVGAMRSSQEKATLPFLSEPWYMPPRPVDPRDNTPLPPRSENYRGEKTELDVWYEKYSRGFELGTVFTMIAGLLNILAVFDALSGPAASASGRKEEPAAVPSGAT